jgi:hypothetical protein
MKLRLTALLSVLASGAALAQPASAPSPAATNGCQPGQVLLANGDACLPLASVPAPPMNAIAMTPAVMSRMLAPQPRRAVVLPSCQPGQVLQANGQPCIPPDGQ